MSEVCTHSWVERAGKAQAGDCVACLKAELDRLGGEWQAEWIRRDDIADRRLTEKMDAVKRAEAAEAALEALALRLEEAVHELEDLGSGSAPMRYGIVNGSALRNPPAEPLRRPEDCDRCDHSDDHGPRCAEPLRTPEPLTPAEMEWAMEAVARANAEPLRTEGAPKQEEATILDVFHGANVATIAALQEEVSGIREMHAAQARVIARYQRKTDRMEKALREAEKALRWTNDYAKAIRDWDGSGTCTLAADVKDAYREVCAALAPEAPVEKEEST